MHFLCFYIKSVYDFHTFCIKSVHKTFSIKRNFSNFKCFFYFFSASIFSKFDVIFCFSNAKKTCRSKNCRIYGNTILLYETCNKLTVIWKMHKEIL